MSTLVFLRHGRTEANARGLLLGRLDPELDELGHRQAAAAARVVLGGSEEVVAVVTSPLHRTRATAEAFGLPVQVDDRFVELDYGEFDGVPMAEVPAATWSRWRSDPDFAPPGGESLNELGDRVRRACADWAEVASRSDGGVVVVVSHVSPIKAAVAWALGVGDEVAWRTRLDPASITRVGVAGGPPVLRSFNETAHLVGVRPAG